MDEYDPIPADADRLKVRLWLPTPEAREEQGLILRVEQFNFWTTTCYELSCGSPDCVGWFRIDYYPGSHMEPPDVDADAVTLATLVGLEGITPVQRSQVVNATERVITDCLRAYMNRDDGFFADPLARPIAEVEWDEFARQVETLRQEWREEVMK